MSTGYSVYIIVARYEPNELTAPFNPTPRTHDVHFYIEAESIDEAKALALFSARRQYDGWEPVIRSANEHASEKGGTAG